MRRLLLGAVTVVGCLLAIVTPARADVPVNVTPPSILSDPPNTAEYGETFGEQGGTWTATVTPYVIGNQWERCDAGGQACVPIAGATGHYYTLQASDVGHTIRLRETASTAPASPAVSAQTPLVGPGLQVNVQPPTVLSNPPNTAVVSQELGAGGAWTPTYAPGTINWQWLRCDAHGQACTPIPGATGNVYTLQPSDLGHTIRVEAFAANAVATGPPAVSDPTIVVTKLHTDAPGDTVEPPFPQLANDPLRPLRAQSSVAYLLQHNGYSAPVEATVRGRLEVTWTTRSKHKTVTLASGQKSLRPGHHIFRVRLTHKGRSILRRGRRLKFSVNAWYITRNPSNLQWSTCRHRGSVKPDRQLAIGKTCGEFLAGPPRLRL